MKKTGLTAVFLTFILLFQGVQAQDKPERQWPCYRGFMSSGVLDNANLPESFDVEKGTNIRWKAEIPGLGLSCPVIWGDKLFVTSAVSKVDNSSIKTGLYGDVTSVPDTSVHEWKVFCYNKNNGKLLWERVACTGVPRIKRHPKSTHANCTPATDGRFVVAFFGSEGLYCYDIKGNLVWKKNFGVLRSAFFIMKNAEWEFASSPIIYDGVVIIQCDVLEDSFVAAFDVATGKELWKTSRVGEYPGWCTPAIYNNNGNTFVALNGYKNRGGYDFKTGKQVWTMAGGGDIPIPTPVVDRDMIYFNSAHGRDFPVYAISCTATGNITLKDNETSNEFIKWSIQRAGSYLHTLLLYRNHLYSVNWNGIIQCFDPGTGKEIYKGKLGNTRSFVASPVASDGKIYIIDENGTVYIIQDGNTFNVLKEIPLNDVCLSAPAISDGSIYFRTQRYLISVGKP